MEVKELIIFKTINCDDLEVNMTFDNVKELQKEWDSEVCDVPCLDDELIYAEIYGKQVGGKTFDDVMKYLVVNHSFKM